LKIDSVDQKLFKIQLTVYENFSQVSGTPGIERNIAFLRLAVKRFKTISVTVIVVFLFVSDILVIIMFVLHCLLQLTIPE
jgi:hypothetical protein